MMAVRAQLVKWGNSQAVRVPKNVLEQAHFEEGEELEMRVEGRQITLSPLSEALTIESLVAMITPENVHKEQDWGKPVGNEAW